MFGGSMNLEKQTLLLQYALSSPDVFSVCYNILNPDYFDPELRNVVNFTLEYYDNYNTLPSETQVEAETNTSIPKIEVSKDQVQYCCDELASFCRRRAVEKVILGAADRIKKGEYNQVEQDLKQAIGVGIQRDLGEDFFDDPYARITRDRSEEVYSTGYPSIDFFMNGGLARKTLTLLIANSGVGKSIGLANLSKNFVGSGLNVLYLSFELSREMVLDRFDTMFSGVKPTELQQKADVAAKEIFEFREKHSAGSLHVARMWAKSCTADIESFLKEFELVYGYVPDVIVTDYMDKMSPNAPRGATRDMFNDDGDIAQELHELGEAKNAIMLSASQQNRDAVGVVDTNQAHIAGGISKINESDNTISLIMSDSMRAQGHMIWKFLKTRSSFGVGNTVDMEWNADTLQITDPNAGAQELKLNGSSSDNNQHDEDFFNVSDDGNQLFDFFDE